MLEKQPKPKTMPELKAGILFNMPHKPIRGEDTDYIAEAEVEDQAKAVEGALEELGFQVYLFPLKNDIGSLIISLKKSAPDVVVNLCEGAFGDSHLEMHVPSMLELLSIPYTGSPPLALGLCQDKGVTKDLLKANDIPTPEYRVLSSFAEWKGEIAYPLFVKPLREDASLGISKKNFVRDNAELETQVEYVVRRYRQPALVEKYIDGRELNVAVLGNEKARVLPISEIVLGFSDGPKIVDYAAKWLETSEEYRRTKPVCPADLEPAAKTKVEDAALKAYKALGCRDYARVDIRLEGNVPYVLEVNPNPDISFDAGFVRSLRAAGIPYKEFIKTIVFFALKRKQERSPVALNKP